jgi:hypothetical protein
MQGAFDKLAELRPKLAKGPAPEVRDDEFLKAASLSEDSVRYYLLCRGCLRRIEASGVGSLPGGEDFQVV